MVVINQQFMYKNMFLQFIFLGRDLSKSEYTRPWKRIQ